MGAVTEDDETRWVRRIKTLRAEHGVGIFEAERIALADPIWRRWVERRINTDPRCRKQALNHLNLHGPAGLIERRGDLLGVRGEALGR